MRHPRSLVLIGLIALVAASGIAQTPTRIDGRKHPELIPDNAAYRAVFLMQSHFATDAETARSEQFHKMLDLSTQDHTAYDRAMVQFRQAYDLLVKAHDDFVAGSSLQSNETIHEEVIQYRQKISALVKSTREALDSSMTPDGLVKLDTFVQSQKSHMIVGTGVAQ